MYIVVEMTSLFECIFKILIYVPRMREAMKCIHMANGIKLRLSSGEEGEFAYCRLNLNNSSTIAAAEIWSFCVYRVGFMLPF